MTTPSTQRKHDLAILAAGDLTATMIEVATIAREMPLTEKIARETKHTRLAVPNALARRNDGR